jgi:hypothetical protein
MLAHAHAAVNRDGDTARVTHIYLIGMAFAFQVAVLLRVTIDP